MNNKLEHGILTPPVCADSHLKVDGCSTTGSASNYKYINKLAKKLTGAI